MPIDFQKLSRTTTLKTTSKSEEVASSPTMSVPQGFKPAENTSVSVAQKGLGSAIFSGISKFKETATSPGNTGVRNERSPQSQINSDTKGVQSSPSQVTTDKPQNTDSQVSNDSSQPGKAKESKPLDPLNFLKKRLEGKTSSNSGSVIPSRFRTHMGLSEKAASFVNINPMANKGATPPSNGTNSVPVENRPPITTVGPNRRPELTRQATIDFKPKTTEAVAPEKTETKSLSADVEIQDIKLESSVSDTGSVSNTESSHEVSSDVDIQDIKLESSVSDTGFVSNTESTSADVDIQDIKLESAVSDAGAISNAEATKSVSSDVSIQDVKGSTSLSEAGPVDKKSETSDVSSASLQSNVETLITNLPAQLSEVTAPILSKVDDQIDQAGDAFVADIETQTVSGGASLSLPAKTDLEAKVEDFTTAVKDNLKAEVNDVIGKIAGKLEEKATGVVSKSADKLKAAANKKIEFYQDKLKTATKEGIADLTKDLLKELDSIEGFVVSVSARGLDAVASQLIDKLATKLTTEIDTKIDKLRDTLNTQISDTIETLKGDLEAQASRVIDNLANKSGATDKLTSMGQAIIDSLPPEQQSLGQTFLMTTLDVATTGKLECLDSMKAATTTAIASALPTPILETAKGVGTSVVGIVKGEINAKIGAAIDELPTFLQAPVKGLLENVKTEITAAGNSFFQGVQDNIQSGATAVSSEVKADLNNAMDRFADSLTQKLDDVVNQLISNPEGDNSASFDDFAKGVKSEIDKQVAAFKDDPPSLQNWLDSAMDTVSAFIDKPVTTLVSGLSTCVKSVAVFAIELCAKGASAKAGAYIETNVTKPLESFFHLGKDETAFMHESFQPGIDTAKDAIRTDIKSDLMADAKQDIKAGGDGKVDMSKDMKALQSAGEGVSGALSAVSVMKGLAEIKDGFNDLRTLRADFKDKPMTLTGLKAIGGGLIKMAAGSLRASASTVAIIGLAGVSTPALAAASVFATPVFIGLGVYTAATFLNKAAASYQASSSFEVVGRLLKNEGPSGEVGGARRLLLLVTTGKNIEELRAMKTDIQTKYGDDADKYVNLERKCHNRQMAADIVRSGTAITATFAFGGLAALIPMTAPFLGPVAFFMPVVVGGAIALTGFKLAGYPETASKEVRTEINQLNEKLGLVDTTPSGPVDEMA